MCELNLVTVQCVTVKLRFSSLHFADGPPGPCLLAACAQRYMYFYFVQCGGMFVLRKIRLQLVYYVTTIAKTMRCCLCSHNFQLESVNITNFAELQGHISCLHALYKPCLIPSNQLNFRSKFGSIKVSMHKVISVLT